MTSRDRHEKLARELGLTSINQPAELGGHDYTTLQQVLIAEQSGRVTNALGWLISTPPGWLPQVATPYQMERYVLPTNAGEKHECYAITEENAGSDLSDLASTARRDGDDYVLNGVKWHVTSANLADYRLLSGASSSTAPKQASMRCSSSTWTRPGSVTCGHRPTPTRMPITIGRWDSRTCGFQPGPPGR